MKINVPYLISCGIDRVILILAAFVAGILVAWLVLRKPIEGFDSICTRCGTRPCACILGNKCNNNDGKPNENVKCPNCPPVPDLSRYVLRTTIPPCPVMPDMSKYILKTEIPQPIDLSRYVLKSSVPKCAPCIASSNFPVKIGECPPCERPRCPVPVPCQRTTCAPCPIIQPQRCPAPDVSCKPVLNYNATQEQNQVRPVMASLGSFNF